MFVRNFKKARGPRRGTICRRRVLRSAGRGAKPKLTRAALLAAQTLAKSQYQISLERPLANPTLRVPSRLGHVCTKTIKLGGGELGLGSVTPDTR